MPLQATSGAASYDAFGGGAASVPNYIEEVFSTYLYTGNGTTQTITNGIDLSTKGGLVWIKKRSAAQNHYLTSTAQGTAKQGNTNNSNAFSSNADVVTAFSTTGFSVGSTEVNDSAATYASWTFRKQPKFFDVVTFTSGAGTQTINHNLGATPGMIIVKCTTVSDSWYVWHRSIPNNALALNTTQSTSTFTNPEYIFGNGTVVVQPTSTQFTFYAGNSGSNTYVAYIYAHNAGGFGLTGTDNVISCGSFNTGASDDVTVSLGYEPQWVMVKATNAAYSWEIYDNMRGMSNPGLSNLDPNLTQADNYQATGTGLVPNATGFSSKSYWGANANLIYVAIRRGPMKVPTDATKVFGLSARSGTGANATVTGGQTDDAVLVKNRGSAVASLFSSRLTSTGYLVTSTTAAEVAAGATILQANPWDVMDGVKVGTTSTITNASGSTFVNYLFKRAPSFMDVVCYTGTGTTKTLTHNLQSVPEFIILKRRSAVSGWYCTHTGLTNPNQYVIELQDTAAQVFQGGDAIYNRTSTSFTIDIATVNNGTYVAYLFATCAGVSKVGSYTGNGTTQTINCGLTAGARFVLIKRTDAVGDWYVYDTARGMTTLTDPYLLTNTTAAEVATLGSVTTVATGFAVNSAILADINVSSATYIFLAVG